MIQTGYIFKPKTRQADEIAEAVRRLRQQGVALPQYNLTISRFCEFAIERTLKVYREAPQHLFQELEGYLSRAEII